jgi:hypothetical protein
MNGFQKKHCTTDTYGAAHLCDLSEILGEFPFFDDEKAIFVLFN